MKGKASVIKKDNLIKKTVALCFFIVGVILFFVSLNIKRVIIWGMRDMPQEITYTLEEFLDAASAVHDFKLENGALRSTSDDPWIMFDINQLKANQIKTIDFEVEQIDINTVSVLYFKPGGDSDSKSFWLSVGNNSYNIESFFGKSYTGYTSIRFDLTAANNNLIKLNKITFNDQNAIVSSYYKQIMPYLVTFIVLFFSAAFALMGSLIDLKKIRTAFPFLNSRKYKKVHKHIKMLMILPILLLAGLFLAFFTKLYILGCVVYTALVMLSVAILRYKSFYVNGYIKIFSLFSVALLTKYIGFLVERASYFDYYMDNTVKNNNSAITVFFVLLLAYVGVIAVTICAYSNCQVKKNDEVAQNIIGLFNLFAITSFLYVLFYVICVCFIYNYSWNIALTHTIRMTCVTPAFMINIFLCMLTYLLMKYFVGKGLAKTIYGIVYVLLLIGNIVKLKYQFNMFMLADIFQIKAAMQIVPNVIGAFFAKLLLLIPIAMVLGIIIFRKKLMAFLKPVGVEIINAVICAFVIFVILFSVTKGKLADVSVRKESWRTANALVQVNGLYLYNYYQLLSIRELYPAKPKGYSDEYMASLNKEFEQYTNSGCEEKGTKPTVILILFESQFDVDNLTNVTIGEDVDSAFDKYKRANLISPCFGGGTALCEYEVLTGYTSMFLNESTIPYTSYINNATDEEMSLVRVFKNNGYTTSIIHPNVASFYSRNVAYPALGFDEYINTSNSFASSDKVNGGYIKNEYLTDEIIEKLESTDEPQFIFGISIESHTPYSNKYDDLSVEISCSDTNNEGEINELAQYIETTKRNNKMLEELVEYIDKSDRDIVLYGFGDHLPSLNYIINNGYVTDLYKKYETVFVEHSNFMEDETSDEYYSLNQVAPEIIHDCGLEHPAYFDYIYSLRNSVPIAQRYFVPDEVKDTLNPYWYLEYDLIFGKKYILE